MSERITLDGEADPLAELANVLAAYDATVAGHAWEPMPAPAHELPGFESLPAWARGDIVTLPPRRSFRVPNVKAGKLARPAGEPVLNFRAFKVGGLRFVRIGEFQFSFCRTRKPIRRT